MSEHLPVILAPFLDVDNNELLHPEAPLRQDVALHDWIDLADWPVGPQLLEVQVVVRLAVDVLL